MIAVLGSANIDLVVEMAGIPGRGETVLGTSMHRYSGGKGANQAVAAARLGADVCFFGKVGKDSPGDEVLRSLHESGVSTSCVERTSDSPTGMACVWVETTGENTIVVVPGANAAVDSEYVMRVFDRLVEADVLLLQFEIPLETVAFVLSQLPVGKPMVIVDPAPVHDLAGLKLERIDILTPNRGELTALTGIEEMGPAGGSLIRRGVRTVVCKAGENGSFWIKEDTVHIPALLIDAVDTTAAGDAFNGALACALADGRPMSNALRWANAAGSLAASRSGAQPSLPTRPDLERFVASRPA